MAEDAVTLPAVASPSDDRPVAMVISPFVTAPADAGQRKRALQTTALLKSAGYDVVFVLLAFEGSWLWRWNQASVDAMKAQWDEVYVYPATPKVSRPPVAPPHHALDEWWDETFGNWLSAIQRIRHFDVVVVHNVWLSKALTLFSPGTVKVLDSHDLFHRRTKLSKEAAQEFFHPSARDEFFGLNRADIVLAIQESETELMLNKLNSIVRYLPYDLVAPGPVGAAGEADYLRDDRVRFGFIGNNSSFNATGLKSLLAALSRRLAMTPAPIELVLAGQVCDILPEDSFHAIRLGYVEDEQEFFDACDIVIAPIFVGTGMKVKSADALARRKPTLFSQHAAEGLPIPGPYICDSADAMAAMMCNIAYKRPSLPRMVADLGTACRMHQRNTKKRADAVLQTIERRRLSVEIDLSRTADADAFTIGALLAFCNARWLHALARVNIFAPDLVGSRLGPLLPPGCQILNGPRQDENSVTKITLSPGNAEPQELTGEFRGHRLALAAPTQSITWDPVIRSLVSRLDAIVADRPGRRLFSATDDPRRDLLRANLHGASSGGLVFAFHGNAPAHGLSVTEAVAAILDGRVKAVYRLWSTTSSSVDSFVFTFAALCGVATTDDVLGPISNRRIRSTVMESEGRNVHFWKAVLHEGLESAQS